MSRRNQPEQRDDFDPLEYSSEEELSSFLGEGVDDKGKETKKEKTARPPSARGIFTPVQFSDDDEEKLNGPQIVEKVLKVLPENPEPPIPRSFGRVESCTLVSMTPTAPTLLCAKLLLLFTLVSVKRR